MFCLNVKGDMSELCLLISSSDMMYKLMNFKTKDAFLYKPRNASTIHRCPNLSVTALNSSQAY